ncbi:MAG: glycosyltransferase family 2 protein [Nitrospira sp. LK70]|nr:glycosyltransferase family 2 protein [Nitrospira sp. LK70]
MGASLVDVSIVVVSWNAREYLVNCLHSIAETRGRLSLEVIVVDNASSDGSPEAVGAQFPWAQLVQTGSNLGFARGNNVGMMRSTGRYVCLINSDVVLLDGCLQGLVEFMDAHPRVGLAGPRILNADRTLQISMRRSPSLWANWGHALFLNRAPLLSALFPPIEIAPSSDVNIREVPVLYGMFWMASREALRHIGGLDEDYFMYGEDVDWCRRFHAANWQVMYYPLSEAIHFGGGSSKIAPVKYFIENRRSRLLYFQKNHGRWARALDAGALLVDSALRSVGWSMACWLGRGDAQHNVLMRDRNVACFRWLMAGSMSANTKEQKGAVSSKWQSPS